MLERGVRPAAETKASRPARDAPASPPGQSESARGVVRPATRERRNDSLAEAGVTNTTAFEQIQNYLDVDNLIDFMILRLWAGDMDWLRSRSEPTTGTRSKDWFAARNRKSSGKFMFFVWDEEISMGKDHEVNRRVNANLVDADVGNSPGRLYTRLRQNPEFRLRFADRLQKHFFGEGTLTRQKNLQRWQELVDLLESPMLAEAACWGSVNNPKVAFTRDNHWHSEVEWVKNTFFVQRNEIVLQQFRRIGLFPSNSAPTLNQNGGNVTAGFQAVSNDTETCNFAAISPEPSLFS